MKSNRTVGSISGDDSEFKSSETSSDSTGANTEAQRSLPAVLHVNLPATQVINEDRKMIAGSGMKLSESFTKPSPLGSFLKTLLESSRWGSVEFSMRWSLKAMSCPADRPDRQYWKFQLARSGHHTGEGGTGLSLILIPTPAAVNEEQGQNASCALNLKGAICQITPLPSPNVKGLHRKKNSGNSGEGLVTAVNQVPLELLATPTASDGKRGNSLPEGLEKRMENPRGKPLSDQVQHTKILRYFPDEQPTDGAHRVSQWALAKLSAWMMGFDFQVLCEHWGTRSLFH